MKRGQQIGRDLRRSKGVRRRRSRSHHQISVDDLGDRKSTRLNSSHITISYAVFCLKKKNNNLNCRGFGPLLEDKLCLIFKLAPSVCRITFPILSSLLVRFVVLLPLQLLLLYLATHS